MLVQYTITEPGGAPQAVYLEFTNQLSQVTTYQFSSPDPSFNGTISISSLGLSDGLYSVIGRYTRSVADGGGSVFASSIPNVRVDTVTQFGTLTAPIGGSTADTSLSIAYTLPETPAPNSVQLIFRLVGAGSDAATLTFDSSTSQSLTINPRASFFSPPVSSSVGFPLADGAYTLRLSYQDLLGNPATTTSPINLTIAAPTPTATATATVTPTTTPTGTATATVTPSATPTSTSTPTGTPTATVTETPTNTPTTPPTVTPTATPDPRVLITQVLSAGADTPLPGAVVVFGGLGAVIADDDGAASLTYETDLGALQSNVTLKTRLSGYQFSDSLGNFGTTVTLIGTTDTTRIVPASCSERSLKTTRAALSAAILNQMKTTLRVIALVASRGAEIKSGAARRWAARARKQRNANTSMINAVELAYPTSVLSCPRSAQCRTSDLRELRNTFTLGTRRMSALIGRGVSLLKTAPFGRSNVARSLLRQSRADLRVIKQRVAELPKSEPRCR